jgi:hypothetical protein
MKSVILHIAEMSSRNGLMTSCQTKELSHLLRESFLTNPASLSENEGSGLTTIAYFGLGSWIFRYCVVGGKANASRYRAKPVAWLVGDFRQIDPRFEPDSSLRKFNIDPILGLTWNLGCRFRKIWYVNTGVSSQHTPKVILLHVRRDYSMWIKKLSHRPS